MDEVWTAIALDLEDVEVGRMDVRRPLYRLVMAMPSPHSIGLFDDDPASPVAYREIDFRLDLEETRAQQIIDPHVLIYRQAFHL